MNNVKDNNLDIAQDFILEEKDIRFNSETDQEKKTKDKVKNIKKTLRFRSVFIYDISCNVLMHSSLYALLTHLQYQVFLAIKF